MNTTPDGIAILHYFESCRLDAYPDPGTGGKPWTIGWGDTGPDVVPGLRITQAQADARFADRLRREFEPGVLAVLTRNPQPFQFDAMVCLAYNIGVPAFGGSTVVRKFNAGADVSAADAFEMWNKSGGQVLLGLRRRRAAERARFLGASAAQAIATGAAIK